jgi:hypothetical protein
MAVRNTAMTEPRQVRRTCAMIGSTLAEEALPTHVKLLL